MEEESWRRNHGGGIMEEGPWRHSEALRVKQRHPGDIQEASRRHPEAPRRHPEGPKRHPEAPRRHPGGTQGAPGASQGTPKGEDRDFLPFRRRVAKVPCTITAAQRRFRGAEKVDQNHRVFLSKVARPTISRERGEGDPHDLRSGRTKVEGHFSNKSAYNLT